MQEFTLSYCRWLEGMAEAQRSCEEWASRVLKLEQSGCGPDPSVEAGYAAAHQSLQRLAGEFPAQPPS